MLRASGVQPRAVFVKVGDGPYVDFNPPAGTDVLAVRKGAFLMAVRENELFASHFKGASLDKCTVSCVTSMATVKPTAKELADKKVLEGTLTIAETAGSGAGNVFVHVALPDPFYVSGKARTCFTPDGIATQFHPAVCAHATL